MPIDAAKDLGVSHSFCAALALLVTKTDGFAKGFAQCLEVEKRPVFVYCDGESQWCDVIALSQASIHQLYACNLRERRWMSGLRPKAHMKIMSLLESAVQEDRRSRRSSRVNFDVLLELHDERFAFAGQTVVVNLHGALIRTSAALNLGTVVTIHVHQTGKAARARVVFSSYEESPHYGIELEVPENIWGLVDAPEDWETFSSDRGTTN